MSPPCTETTAERDRTYESTTTTTSMPNSKKGIINSHFDERGLFVGNAKDEKNSSKDAKETKAGGGKAGAHAAGSGGLPSAQNTLYNFLLTFKNVEKGVEFTHTSFLRPTGSFYIPMSRMDEFYKLYAEALGRGESLHLTEKHRDIGPVVMDLDFRYDAPPPPPPPIDPHEASLLSSAASSAASSSSPQPQPPEGGGDLPQPPSAAQQAVPTVPVKRRHTASHVDAIVRCMSAAVARYVLPPSREFDVVVLEKPGPAASKSMVKDGIHLIVPEVVTRPGVQYMMREAMLKDPEFRQILADLRISNRPEDCLDEAVIERNNWTMYGSSKPNSPPYSVTSIHRCRFPVASPPPLSPSPFPEPYAQAQVHTQAQTQEQTQDQADISNDRVEKRAEDAALLKRRVIERLNDPASLGHPTDLASRLSIRNKYVPTPVRCDRIHEINAYQSELDEKARKRRACQVALDRSPQVHASRANTSDCFETARRLVELLDTSRTDNYSHWMQVGWCLRNIDHRLLDAWENFSRRSSKYLEGECPRLWARMRLSNLSIGTLHMWARKDNPEAYRELMRNDLFDLIHRSASGTHHDVARVVHHMYKYEYVCVSVKNKTWCRFRDHRWVPSDAAYSLRHAMSTTVFSEYMKVVTYHTTAMANAAMEDSEGAGSGARNTATDRHTDMSRALFNVASKLKDTRYKDYLLRECCEMFYHEKFEEKLDSNPYLIGFPNGVYDLEAMEFREGRPDDFVSFNAGVEYIPFDRNCEPMKELLHFFEQVLPNKNVREYMLTTLASFLCGFTREERFHIWTGSGSNGKSKVVELFEQAFGEYTCKFPVTLLTGKRAASNAATSEIARAKGKRFAVLQEPSEGERLNIGIMKELTGGDRIQARSLFKEPIEFKPMFKLALLCNEKPTVPSDDGGTWRRIRVVDFTSKFVPYTPTQPNELPMDDSLPKKFEYWAPHLMALLIEYYRAYSVGRLTEPEEVLKCTREYQKDNDHYTDFADTCIERSADDFLSLDDVFQEFREWVRADNIPISIPKKKIVRNYMDRILGKISCPNGPNPGYKGYRLRDRFAVRPDLQKADADDE